MWVYSFTKVCLTLTLDLKLPVVMFISYLYFLGNAVSFLNSRTIPPNSQALWHFYNGFS